MNRTLFMNWAESFLARALGVPRVNRDDDNNVRTVLATNLTIGIVARNNVPAEVRVHIWTTEPARRARWNAGASIPGPFPPGATLRLRSGARAQNLDLLEFAWPNPDTQNFQPFVPLVEACVGFFLDAHRRGLIP